MSRPHEWEPIQSFSQRCATTSFHLYTDLPPELRRQIRLIAIETHHWPLLYEMGHSDLHLHKAVSPLAPYACIDREWREDVERLLFRDIHLHECKQCTTWRRGELETFEALFVGARQSYLSTIYIHFTACIWHEPGDDLYRATVITSKDGTVPASLWLRDDGIISVLHKMFDGLKHWALDKHYSKPLEARIDLYNYTAYQQLTSASVDWPMAPIFTPSELPAIPFVRTSFHSHCGWEATRALPLLRTFKSIPNLRSVRMDHIISDHPWSPTDSEMFMRNFEDAVPGLKELHLDGAGFDNKLSRQSTKTLHKLTLGLEVVVLNKIVDLGLFFEPYDFCHPIAQGPPSLSWQSLRVLEITVQYPPGHGLSVQGDRSQWLMTVAGRAVAFMPSLELFSIVTEYPPYLGFRLRTVTPTKASLTDKGQSSLSIDLDESLPSSTVVGIWRDSIMQTKRVALEVRVSFQGLWRTWEDAMEDYAAQCLEELDIGSDET